MDFGSVRAKFIGCIFSAELFAQEKLYDSKGDEEESLQKQGVTSDCYVQSCGEVFLRVVEVVSLHASTVGDCQKLNL